MFSTTRAGLIRFLALLLVAFSAVVFFVVFPEMLLKINDIQHRARYFLWAGNATSDCQISPQKTKKQILLVTFARSGSSFTSALISHHDDVFFVFEPLGFLDKFNLENNNEADSIAVVRAYLSCNFTVQYSFALNNYHLYTSESTRPLYSCMQSVVSAAQHISCFLQMLESCRSHPVTFVKTIRFQVNWAKSFLAENPHFKLLFLVRDPRAKLFSEARMFRNFNWSSEIYNKSRQHCFRLGLELQEAERLSQLYPDQVKGIRYEHGATDPLSYARDIYNFIGVSFDDKIANYIINITTAPMSSENLKDPLSVLRHNATLTMNKWRFSIDFNSVQVIDKACGHLYSKLGYVPVLSQQHLVSESSLVVSPEPGGILHNKKLHH